MAAAHEDLAGNSGPVRQYNTFLLTAATRLDDSTTKTVQRCDAARRVEVLFQAAASHGGQLYIGPASANLKAMFRQI
jgi:hypothetical protein